MANRTGFSLNKPLMWWNFSLSLFSFIGMLRTVPQLFYILATSSFEESICGSGDTWGNGASGLWVTLFIFSKIPELIDTVFIVLRKRPLIFLHWYHHITVLLYCWHAFATMSGNGLYFVAMNYSVHAVMYGYYCMAALGMRPKWLPPYMITIAQIAQMFVGTAVCIASYIYLNNNPNCSVNSENIFYGSIMYASYFALFLEFAIKRFILKSGKGKME